MAYTAAKRLKWGTGFIEPGEPVPEDDTGRSYGSMLRTGAIRKGSAPSRTDESEKASIQDEATVLGLAVDKRWSIDTLKQKIADAQAEADREAAEKQAAEDVAKR